MYASIKIYFKSAWMIFCYGMHGHTFISFDVTTEAVIVFLSEIIIGALLPEARPVSVCQTF